MSSFILGYERINKYNQIIDVLVKKKGNVWELIQPLFPSDNVNLAKSSFINLDMYSDEKYLENVKLHPAIINSDGRKYIALKISDTRYNTVFRYMEVDSEEDLLVARFHIEEIVVGHDKSKKVPNVYVNKEGEMDLEDVDKLEKIKRRVILISLTDLDGVPVLEDIESSLEEWVERGFNKRVIKEAGDCEISLSVLNQHKNL